MSKDLIHEKFVGAIREKIPHKATLTNTLVDLLRLEKEAVYRRMRGDVAFSFAEIALISHKLGSRWIIWSEHTRLRAVLIS